MTETNALSARRRANLQAWIAAHGVTKTWVAEKMDVGIAYVSLLFNPSRSFGERAARSIEKKLHMEEGFLDSNGEKSESSGSWVSPKDLDDGMFGLIPPVELQIDPATGEKVLIRRRLPDIPVHKDKMLAAGVYQRDGLVTCRHVGDSMAPGLLDGDLVLIDMSQAEVRSGDTYAIKYGNEVRIRNLDRRFDGGIIIRATNPRYSEESLDEVQSKQITVLGRVLSRSGWY